MGEKFGVTHLSAEIDGTSATVDLTLGSYIRREGVDLDLLPGGVVQALLAWFGVGDGRARWSMTRVQPDRTARTVAVTLVRCVPFRLDPGDLTVRVLSQAMDEIHAPDDFIETLRRALP